MTKRRNKNGRIVGIIGMVIGAVLMLTSYFLWKGTDGFFGSVHSDIFGGGIILFILGLIYTVWGKKLIS